MGFKKWQTFNQQKQSTKSEMQKKKPERYRFSTGKDQTDAFFMYGLSRKEGVQ